MNIPKQTIKPIVILLSAVVVMAALCVFLYRFDNKYTYPGDTGLNGVTILEEESLRACPAAFLARGWEFYQYKLLTPEDFEKNPPVPDAYVYIGQYGGFELGDHNADPHGSATYRIRVSLPETPRSYALELPEIYSSCRVYINGVLLAQRGEPDLAAYRPEIKTGVITFWAGGQAEIIIAAGDYSYFYSGLVYPPAFGLPEAVSAIVGKRLMARTLFCFAALLAGIAFIVAGLRQKNRLKKAYGITCLFFMGYACYPLMHAAGWSGPLLWYRVENLCYCLTLLMTLVIQNRLCEVSARISRAVTAYGVAICLPAVFPGQFSQSLDGMMLYSRLIDIHKLAVFAYLLAAAVYAASKKAAAPRLQLSGIAAFGVSLLMDRMLPLFEPVYTGWFPELGGVALVACLGADIWLSAARSGEEALALRQELALMAERLNRADSLLRLQSDWFESLREDIDETRRKDHDMRHHISLLKELLRVNPKKAAVYMEELSSSLSTAEPLCGNVAADCVIRQYVLAAGSHGIVVETAVNIPEMPGISDVDLCVVLGNLLENALEALRKEPEKEKRLIRVSAGMTGNMLAINVDNSLYKPPRYREGVLMSGKRDAPGVGLLSISAVADKYDGKFWWKTVDGMFRAFVVLKMEKQVTRYENSCVRR